MQLTTNFHLAEFSCKDGSPVPADKIPVVQQLANNLQVLRDSIGDALHINSAYRTPAYNKKIGGVKDSQHIQCKAADITAKNFTPKQLAARIEKLIKDGQMVQGGIGVYKGFVHYDIRGTAARWNG